MTDPREPQYPYQGPPADPSYPPPSHPPPGQPPPSYPPPGQPPRGTGLATRFGDRIVRRPEPRLGVSLAGAGVGLAVLGVLVWGGDYLTTAPGGRGGGGGSSRPILGIVLSLVVVVVGYTLVLLRRRGPLATAGVAASALGIPLLLGFLSYDTARGGHSGPPFSLDAVVLVSVLVWVLSYLAVPGARGHSFYLGLAAVTIWPYVLDKAEPTTFSLVGFLRVFAGNSPIFAPSRGAPDWTTVAVISLLFGLGYYLVAFVLDRGGRRGPGAALAVGGVLATATGIAAAAVHLHAIGTGITLIVLGLILAWSGASGGRRFTTWTWSAGVGLGVTVIIAKLASDNNAAAGAALIVSGAVVVLAGQLLASALHEPDDLAPNDPGLPATDRGQAY